MNRDGLEFCCIVGRSVVKAFLQLGERDVRLVALRQDGADLLNVMMYDSFHEDKAERRKRRRSGGGGEFFERWRRREVGGTHSD